MRISGTTTLLGLIGTPVEHSKSPAMYNHCFQKFGLDWAYLAFNIPQEKAGDAVQAIRTLGMRGANVTMPCKNAVIPYLDKLTPAAEAIQAVNKGLEAFGGVVLLASHDHELLTSTCNRVIAFQPDGTIIDKYGTYDDYLAWMAERKQQG